MTLDRRGDIGFMEAMAGAMTVCLVMTAFTAFLAAETLSQQPEPPSFDWGLIGKVGISDGEFNAEPACSEFPENNRISGLLIRIYSPAFPSIGEFEEMYGTESEESVCERRIVSVSSGDASVPAVMEAILYL